MSGGGGMCPDSICLGSLLLCNILWNPVLTLGLDLCFVAITQWETRVQSVESCYVCLQYHLHILHSVWHVPRSQLVGVTTPTNSGDMW